MKRGDVCCPGVGGKNGCYLGVERRNDVFFGCRRKEEEEVKED